MIENIKYRDKSYPIRIGYSALEKFKQETGKSLDELQETDEEGNVISSQMEFHYFKPLFYYSLVSGARAMRQKLIVPWYNDKGEEIEKELKREDEEIIEDMLDECFWEFTAMFPKFFPNAEDVVGAKKHIPGNRGNKGPKLKKDPKPTR